MTNLFESLFAARAGYRPIPQSELSCVPIPNPDSAKKECDVEAQIRAVLRRMNQTDVKFNMVAATLERLSMALRAR